MATDLQDSTSDLMTFCDNYKTPLAAGSYRFVLQQTVKVEGEGARHYYRDQPFEVQAPRYTIDGSEIQARFPPPGGVADYQNTLPHLVLRTRALPWERTVWSGAGGEPWLALLMLSEQDVLEGQVVAKIGTLSDLAPQQKEAAYWSRAEGAAMILLPKSVRAEDPQTAVQLLDLDLKLFLKLCPRRKELPLLAHLLGRIRAAGVRHVAQKLRIAMTQSDRHRRLGRSPLRPDAREHPARPGDRRPRLTD